MSGCRARGGVRSWRSPVSLEAATAAAVLRESLDALGYRYTRKQGEKSFADTVSLDPNQRGTPTWRFFVEAPATFTLETYDTRPRPKGTLGFVEAHGLRDEDEPALRRLLRRVAEDAPRKPWSFTLDQRMLIGPFHGAFKEARRAWENVASDEPLWGTA